MKSRSKTHCLVLKNNYQLIPNEEDDQAQIERKIIVGGENLLEKAELQAKLLEENEKKLEKQRAKAQEIKEALQQKEEEKLMLEEKFSSLHEEAQSKTKKLKKLRTMILQAQSELKDVQTDHQREIEGLLESVREMGKELKLQMQIINSYIPIEFQVRFYCKNYDFVPLRVFCTVISH